MASDAPRKRAVSHVILDLDGTLLDTESLVQQVSRTLVEKYGKTWTLEGSEDRIGKRPLESAALMVEQFDLPCSPEVFLSQSLELLSEKWGEAQAMPGAERLLQHLHKHGVPMAIASSSPRKNINAKLSYFPGWLDLISVIVAGDEIPNGKPAPDIFLQAAKLLGASPSGCLVIEDAPAGVQAAKSAGMAVIAVPSLPRKSSRSLYHGADTLLSSLLDLQPQDWGLPAFEDWMLSTLPIQPWRMKGPVIKGFGRGSKMLGIPTANLPPSSFSGQVADHTCGIYLGWAGLSNRGVFKTVMSVGWNPYFDNQQKTVEPWLLHEFEEDFYGEELRLVVVGYIRAEADFPSLEALVARIHKDADIARLALSAEAYAKFEQDPFLASHA